jgi:TonB family protein
MGAGGGPHQLQPCFLAQIVELHQIGVAAVEAGGELIGQGQVIPHQGVALVTCTLTGSGAVSGVRLARSSGSSDLDRATIEMVRRAAPFPAGPSGLPAPRSFSAPVTYRLSQ